MTPDEILKKLELITADDSSAQSKKSKTEKEEFLSGLYEKETLEGLRKRRYKQNTNLRKWLSCWAATVVSFWLIFVACVLIYNSILNLSNSVLITLLSTTTIQVLGIMMIVVQDLFDGKSEDKK